MMIVVPTVAEFLVRFPEFEDSGTERIALVLDEAATMVSEDWIAVHVPMAIQYLAAHFLYVETMLAAEVSQSQLSMEGGTAGPAVMKSVGPLTVRYKGTDQGGSSLSTTAGGAGSSLETSPYGQRFLELARMSFPPIVAVI